MNSIISFFDYGGNTYLVQDKSAGATFADGTDIIVGLTGTVDLSTASLSGTAADPVLMIV